MCSYHHLEDKALSSYCARCISPMSFPFLLPRVFAFAFVLLGLSELFQLRIGAYQHELTVFLLFSFVFLHSSLEWGFWNGSLFLALVYAVVAVAEGLFSDLVFGAKYEFTAHCTLGPPLLLGRPLFLPVAWYVSSYPAMCVVLAIRAEDSTVLSKARCLIFVCLVFQRLLSEDFCFCSFDHVL